MVLSTGYKINFYVGCRNSKDIHNKNQQKSIQGYLFQMSDHIFDGATFVPFWKKIISILVIVKEFLFDISEYAELLFVPNDFDQRNSIMRSMVLFPGVLSKHCDYYLIRNVLIHKATETKKE